ncbi:hypothetical protein AWC38_SpisGene15417 [Stylophora pistillata]|uniref:Uncharacterized protein n=1 Tax=Stylophora pistillata TaxID=50429 RepID=A0A2B4RTK5_STYPI|nr:hypothetical protein AWC38_SpisGene15417 [Stylophora pistillata]
MSCPWVSNRDKKTSEKTMKYAPLRWELKQRYPGYEINQCNIILDVLGVWSKNLDVTLQKLVGSKAKDVLKKMQKLCLSGTADIARAFKVDAVRWPRASISLDTTQKVLFYELLYDEGFIDEIPPWYSPDKPKPVYESENVKAYWDVPIYADQQEVRCNRVDARIVNHMCKRVVTLEMSCPWVNNRTRKDEEKILKYGPLRWELRQQFPGHEVKQYNIIMDALGGWSRELDVMTRELVGGRSTDVLRKMQRVVLSGTLNNARTFKVAV